MIYDVTIEETISQTFQVEAKTSEEASYKAIGKYKTGEFTVEDGSLVCTQMAVDAEDGSESVDWFKI